MSMPHSGFLLSEGQGGRSAGGTGAKDIRDLLGTVEN